MKLTINHALVGAAALAVTACGGAGKNASKADTLAPEASRFVAEVDGKTTGLYELTNEAGMKVYITNYGGRVVSILVPDRDGNERDVVLGFDSIQAYFPENNATDFGAAIGRYANRIDHGRLVIDGDTVQLPVNNFGHTLHGGPTGWQYAVYDVVESSDSLLTLSITSPDGDNNFPGTVTANVTYRLTPDNKLDIAYSAVTDKPTVINMTNHSYFNLSGDPNMPVTDHVVYINADSYTPVDSAFMTTGEIATVAGTPMDFTTPKPMGQEVDNFDFVQLKNGNGYDHNWVLNTKGSLDEPAASVASPSSGIVLTVYTDEPGIQFYTGNFLDGTVTGKKGVTYGKRAAMCLETQHYPDSPNKPEWPSVVLRPGDTYNSRCIYAFGVDK